MSAGYSGNEPTPDMDEVQQQEAQEIPAPPVPVAVCGPVRVQQLPSRTASMRSISVLDVETIAGEDDRRQSIALYAATGGQGFYVGTDRQMVASGAAAFFDGGVLVRLSTTERLYARTEDATLATAVQLTIIQELWAD